MDTMDELRHYARRVTTERNKYAEQLSQRFAQIEVLEQRLRRLQTALGQSSPSVAITDAVPPQDDGVHLRQDAAAYRIAEGAQRPARQRVERAWWPRAAKGQIPLKPNAGWAQSPLHGRIDKILGIDVCGLDRARLHNVVALIAQQQNESRDFVPLFLYDGQDFDLIRHHGYVVEWLPPPHHQRAVEGHQDWRTYSRRRLSLLKRKWNLAEIVRFGAYAFGTWPEAAAPTPAQAERGTLAQAPALADAGIAAADTPTPAPAMAMAGAPTMAMAGAPTMAMAGAPTMAMAEAPSGAAPDARATVVIEDDAETSGTPRDPDALAFDETI